MSFFPFSLTLSYEIVVRSSLKNTNTSSKQGSSSKETPCSLLQHSVSSDSSERFLSPSTRRLQQKIRDRMRTQWEAVGDADSLTFSEAAHAARHRRERKARLREQKADAESLSVLMRASETIKGLSANAEGSKKTLSKRSSWSSFDEVGIATRSPSPRPISSPGPREEADDPFDEPGPRNGFARSLMQQSQLREASKIWRESSHGRPSSRGNVAELLKYYDELEAST